MAVEPPDMPAEPRDSTVAPPDMAATPLDPRRVLTFRAVARAGSFSRAAEALALTQPAVSQQVAALERQLGTRLLDRAPGRTGGVTATEAGALLLAHADAIADRLGAAARQLAELRVDEASRLRVGAFSSAIGTLVPAAIGRLHADQPELVVEAVEGPSPELAVRVARAELHAAICFQDGAAPRREHDGTVRHDLGGEPLLAGLPPGHRLAGGKSIHLSDLAGDDWTAPSRDGLIHRACVAAGFEPRITYLTVDPLGISGVIGGGLAVSLVPALLAEAMPGVAVVPLEPGGPTRSLYAVTPAAGTRPAATAFVAAVRAALATMVPADRAPA
jgi:molybdate transport repressor ModE-like protein